MHHGLRPGAEEGTTQAQTAVADDLLSLATGARAQYHQRRSTMHAIQHGQGEWAIIQDDVGHLIRTMWSLGVRGDMEQAFFPDQAT